MGAYIDYYEKTFTDKSKAEQARKATRGKLTTFYSWDENENPILIYCVQYKPLFQPLWENPRRPDTATKAAAKKAIITAYRTRKKGKKRAPTITGAGHARTYTAPDGAAKGGQIRDTAHRAPGHLLRYRDRKKAAYYTIVRPQRRKQATEKRKDDNGKRKGQATAYKAL